METKIQSHEENAGEELIEIVIEEQTSSSVDSPEPEKEREQTLSPPAENSAEPDDYTMSEPNSPEIRVEIMEDSNSLTCANQTEVSTKMTEESEIKLESDEKNDPEGVDQEDEISIVYLDENDAVLKESSEHPPEIVSDSDATMDSMDLKNHVHVNVKGKRSVRKQKQQERAFERLKTDRSVCIETKKIEEEKEEAMSDETSNEIEKLEEQVKHIEIEEKVQKCTFESPKRETMDVDEVASESEQVMNKVRPDESFVVAQKPLQDNTKDDRKEESKEDSKQEIVQEQVEDEASTSIRRSNRIKTISHQNRRSVGHGLVKDREKFLKKSSDDNSSGQGNDPLKVKSRWRRLSEIEMGLRLDDERPIPDASTDGPAKTTEEIEEEQRQERICEERLKHFVTIKENEYKCDRNISREAKKMLCDCFLTQDEVDRGELGCGEDCLNRLLMIECGPKCNIGARCTNHRFQNAEYAKCRVFRTEKKGFGIAAAREIQPNEFIMEYVGEVLDSDQFERRANDYSNDKNKHYYFMALRSDAVIDATTRGNISRFINHSCDPNAETQKWTVNGELRIGFFSTRFIPPGE